MANSRLPTGLIGGVEERAIEIFDYDPHWAVKFDEHAKKICAGSEEFRTADRTYCLYFRGRVGGQADNRYPFGGKRCQRRGDISAGRFVRNRTLSGFSQSTPI